MNESKQINHAFEAELEEVSEKEIMSDMLMLDEEDNSEGGTVDKLRKQDRSNWTQSIRQD